MSWKKTPEHEDGLTRVGDVMTWQEALEGPVGMRVIDKGSAVYELFEAGLERGFRQITESSNPSETCQLVKVWYMPDARGYLLVAAAPAPNAHFEMVDDAELAKRNPLLARTIGGKGGCGILTMADGSSYAIPLMYNLGPALG